MSFFRFISTTKSRNLWSSFQRCNLIHITNERLCSFLTVSNRTFTEFIWMLSISPCRKYKCCEAEWTSFHFKLRSGQSTYIYILKTKFLTILHFPFYPFINSFLPSFIFFLRYHTTFCNFVKSIEFLSDKKQVNSLTLPHGAMLGREGR